MEYLQSNLFEYLDIVMLIFVRILAMMSITPFFSDKNISPLTKVSFAGIMAILLFNIIPKNIAVDSTDVIGFAFAIANEFVVGWLIGFSVFTVFQSLTLAGQFIDYQIGFSMVSVFDPLSQTQITITGNLFYFIFLMIFLATRSYYFVLKGIKYSFEVISLGKMGFSMSLFNSFISFFGDFFLIALQIAAPIFFVMLITNVVLGILARAVPQLNMFVIGFPLKIILGLMVLYLTMYLFADVASIVLEKANELFNEFIRGLAI